MRTSPRPRVQLFCGPSLTKQSFRDECNINTIMAKYRATGLVDHVSSHQGQYSDYSEVVDYQTALNTVIQAQEMFMTIPSNIRAHFNNDPAQFLSFVEDPSNRDEMIRLGLIPKPVPVVVPVDNASPEALNSNKNAPE